MDKVNKMATSIPTEKQQAVNTALQATFRTTTVDAIELLTGGLSSALVYKITVRGKPYVLRIVMEIDALSDPARQFTCMKAAAAAGIAPAVHYTSEADALSLTDFVASQSFSAQVTAPEERLQLLAATIKTLHATPLFPPLVNFLDGIDIFIQQYKALNVLPDAATAEHFAYYAEIQQSYPRYDGDVVSSHNDLNPNNMLFDGKQLWFIDWEAAFQNDRYVDLAIAARPFVTDAAQEESYLRAYFGDALDDTKRARFFLMQQICHMYYGMIMLKFAAAARPADFVHDAQMATQRLHEFHAQVGAGTVSLATYEAQLLYGKTLLNEMLHGMKTPRFAESIRRMQTA